MSMPPQILEQICERAEKTSGSTIPFPLRGISINRDLIRAAIVILNNSPQKTLPQNCRNDIRARTPDGLDLRIKEYLDTDLRTANIISDILSEAGVVEVITVVNPKTGRMVKGTRLLEKWSWAASTENHGDKKNILMNDCNQVQFQKVEPVKQSALDNPGKEEYLNDPDVERFISWLEDRLDKPGVFEHQYYLVKANRQWCCGCLYEAYEKYWWPYDMICPVQGKRVSGRGFNEVFEYMKQLAEVFRFSVKNKNPMLTRKSTLAMLTWGGVLNQNRERIVEMGDRVCDYFLRIKDNLNLATVRLGNHEGIFINSGFTKLYFLLVDDFIMYDGRVGAALGLLGRLYAEESGLERIPQSIEFSFGSGKVSDNRYKTENRRDPSKGKFKLPSFNGNYCRHINDNIKASWLLKEIADKTSSRFSLLPQGSSLNERLTAMQAALFMIGYDVRSDRK